MAQDITFETTLLVLRALDQAGVACETAAPPHVFAVCSACADMVAALDPKLSARFGYRVDGCPVPAHVPFYWRQCRWVLLGRDGWLTELPDNIQTA